MEGLPHLGEGPEVYETSDTESIGELGKGDLTDNDDIDRAPLDAATAQTIFESDSDRVYIQEDSVDFSGNLDVSEIGLSGYTVRKHKETREQKLRRIARELEDLETEDKLEQQSLQNYQRTLESLIHSPDKGTFTAKINDLFKEIEAEINVLNKESTSDTRTNTVRSQQSSQLILELESRINGIETMLGLESLGDHRSLNLHEHLKDLERKVEFVFDPEYEIMAIKDQIESMNADLDAFNIKKRVSESKYGASDPSSGVFEKSVTGLYDKLNTMERYENALPHMISRLKTLNEIHMELGEKVQLVTELDSTLDSISRDMKSWNDNLDLVNRDLDARSRAFEDNATYVDKRISELEMKLMKLNATNEA